MNKKKRRKRKSNFRKFVKLLLAALVIVIAILVISAVWKAHKENAATEEIEGSISVENEAVFPYELEDGKLEVNSLFQFSGQNPDCGEEDGENIASLEVVNKSGQHLANAKITVTLESGAELRFEITDLPAGQSVMVFEKNNTSYETSDKCITVEDTAEFEETTALMEDRLAVDVQETSVTLTNTSDEDLTNLLLHCHCFVDDTYFGGLTYSYSVESIPAGQSITVQADECYLGTAAVVRINQDNGEE